MDSTIASYTPEAQAAAARQRQMQQRHRQQRHRQQQPRRQQPSSRHRRQHRMRPEQRRSKIAGKYTKRDSIEKAAWVQSSLMVYIVDRTKRTDEDWQSSGERVKTIRYETTALQSATKSFWDRGSVRTAPHWHSRRMRSCHVDGSVAGTAKDIGKLAIQMRQMIGKCEPSRSVLC